MMNFVNYIKRTEKSLHQPLKTMKVQSGSSIPGASVTHLADTFGTLPARHRTCGTDAQYCLTAKPSYRRFVMLLELKWL